MALKGSVTIDATPNSCDRLVFAWTATQDTEARTSTVDWTMKLVADATYGLITGVIEGTRTWSVTIDGETFTGQNGVNVQPGETRLLAQGTIDLVHNDDGTRSFDFTFSQEIGITWGASSGNPQEIGTVTGSGSGELDAFEPVEEPEPDPDEPEEPEEPETEKFDLRSFLTGLAMALVSRGQFPKPTAEPVAWETLWEEEMTFERVDPGRVIAYLYLRDEAYEANPQPFVDGDTVRVTLNGVAETYTATVTNENLNYLAKMGNEYLDGGSGEDTGENFFIAYFDELAFGTAMCYVRTPGTYQIKIERRVN